MKKCLTKTVSGKPMTVCGVLLILIAPTRLANAAALHEARVSQVIQDVRLLEAHAAPRSAAVNDKVTVGSAVHTGAKSRAELTFQDLTITRLGANTIFSFAAGAREAELTRGAILLQVPPNAPAVRANTTSVTVSVMGGTALLSTGPPSKFMVLEGTGEIYPLGHPEKAVTVHGGEMVLSEGGRVSKPEKFDVKLVLATSPLLVDFPPLTNLPLILTVVDQQTGEQPLLVTNQLPSKSIIDTIDVTNLNTTGNPVVVANTFATPTPPPPTPTPPPPTPTPPPPTPSKFGTPTVITSPNPYLITNGTTITTDPSITTNGMTDFGKIYRDPTDDGPFTLWAFGSTSAFDTALNIDTEFFADPNRLPIAVFKFQNLSLNGNPIIDTSNNGVTKLALIGVNGIISGPPGGTLTFTGLDLLLLATVNGSINLTSDVSFQGLNELVIYARGAGSTLTVNSPISNVGDLKLGSEGSIQLNNPGTMSVGEFEATAGNNLTLQIGGSLLLDGKNHLDTLVLPGTTLANGANVTLNVSSDYTNNSTTDFSQLRVRNDDAHIGTGGNINANIGGNLTAMNDFNLFVQNRNGQIDNGGNISLGVGGNLTTAGLTTMEIDNELDMGASATRGGIIGSNVTLNLSANTVSADALVVDVLNENDMGGVGTTGGHINGSAAIAVNVNGALVTGPHDPSTDLFIENYGFSDGTPGGYIGSNATINLTAGSISAPGGSNISIANDDGGTIGGSATIHVTAGSVSMGELEFAGITNANNFGGVGSVGGHITGAASINFNITGALSIAGDDNDGDEPARTTFAIDNNGFGDSSPGGHIGSDASISISAGSISDGGRRLQFLINNSSLGTIAGNASISLNTGIGSISSAGNMFVQILNDDLGNGGGTIGGDATIDVSAGDVTAHTYLNSSLALRVLIGNGGTIGGNAIIDFASSGNVNTQGPGNALFQIANRTIGGDAILNVSAANISTGNYLHDQIVNGGGSIAGSATSTFSLTGDLNTAADAGFEIFNQSNGSIGSNASINLNIGGNLTTGSGNALDISIGNSDGGMIGGDASIAASIHGNVNTTDLNVGIQDYNGGRISGGGDVTLNIGGSLTNAENTHPLFLFVNTFNGGSINNGGNILASVGGDLSSGNISAGIQNQDGGTITTGGNFNLTVGGNLTTAQNTDADFFVSNFNGGSIGNGGSLSLSVGGGISAGRDLDFTINNNPNGIIGSGAMIGVTANSIAIVGSMNTFLLNEAGSIGGNAAINFLAPAGIDAGNGAFFAIVNEDNGGTTPGGTIHGDALVQVTAGHLSTEALVTSDFNLFGTVHNSGGSIVGNAGVMFDISGAITTQGRASFDILNFGDGGPNGGGTIGGDATVNVSANSLTTTTTNGDANFAIYNTDTAHPGSAVGSIGGNATIDLNLTGDLAVSGNANFAIGNSNGGTIGSDATINVSAANITANSLVAQIDNTGGSIGASNEGGATINMNVSNSATVTGDATAAIYGSDGAVGGAAINVNGGNYNVGGQFLTYIDGNGTITFNNATAHADVLKAGVFGANGVLNVGGGILSANTTLELYASGSNGALNFVSNVTLGGNAVKILAANSITIFNNIVVTINGPAPADVYTNNANYTGFGGNGTTTGTFAGAGAHNPQPLANAPPFGPSSPSHPTVTTPHTVGNRERNHTINVSNTDQLLALLDGATVGPDGTARVSASTTRSNLRDPSRTNMNGLPRGVRGMLIQEMRDRSTARIGGRRVL